MGVPPPHKNDGLVYLVAHVKGKPGSGDKLAELLAAIKKRAESDEEPNCLLYRVSRHGTNKDNFCVFEQYRLPSGLDEHMSPVFQAFAESGLAADIDIQYYDDVPAA